MEISRVQIRFEEDGPLGLDFDWPAVSGWAPGRQAARYAGDGLFQDLEVGMKVVAVEGKSMVGAGGPPAPG